MSKEFSKWMLSLPEEKYEALSVIKITDLREAFTAGRVLGREERDKLREALLAVLDYQEKNYGSRSTVGNIAKKALKEQT